MTAGHVLLALAVAVIWGLAFVATRMALDVVSPPLLTALRFLVAAVPALWLPRPRVGWSALVAVGLTLYAGQFLLQFFGIALGMPPGLAAIVIHTQALFTILFAALLLGERPSCRQWAGTALAFAGLATIASTVGHDLTAIGLCLTGLAAMSFGLGNVLLKRLPPTDTLGLVVWLSLVPTVLAYAMWGWLLRRYASATVAPFALLVPFVAAGASALVFRERFSGLRLAGMVLVMLGLAVIVMAARDALSSARMPTQTRPR